MGTLTVAGDLLLDDGSTYFFEIDAEQNADFLVVVGEARIDSGATFELSSEDGVYLDQMYPMIRAGTLTGTFESLRTDYTFIDLNFIADTIGGSTELGMVAERNTVPMAAFAQTNNQRAVANAIEAQSGLAEPYNDVILNDDPSQLPGWYQDWSGEIYSANQAALIYNSRLLAQVVNWRLEDSWLEATQSTRLQQVGQTNQDTTVWIQAYGNWDKFSANANAQKASANNAGFILGIDRRVSPNFRLGAGFSASFTNTSVASSSAGTSGYHVMLYGTYSQDKVRLNAGAVQSWYTAQVNRTLPLDDAGNASGTVASRSTQLFADLSSPITINQQEGQHTTISPFGQVSQIWLHTSNFGETGAQARLTGQATNASTGFGTLGARLSHQWQSDQTNWQASLSVGWQRAWGDLSPTTTLAFATGPDFTVSSAAIARDSAVIEVGIGASLGLSSRFNLVYSATLANQSNSQMLQAQLQWWF
ncbi:MAG: autotransporter outer membrane beta-barrel domain-containing protein [Burkholderiaceae bacterium]|nr:autotransporter outer membrane beta-barrel domain-containing protein [Burkholderiaceae bacterium]